MNKKFIAAALTTFLTGTLFAGTEMIVELKNGEVKKFDVSNVSEINFMTETPVVENPIVDEEDSPLEFLFFTSYRTSTVSAIKKQTNDSIIIVPSKVRSNGKVYDVTKIGKIAFHGYDNLKSVYIPESVTHIGDQAFYFCGGLETINLPSKLNIIYSQVFANCYKLSSINIPDNVIKIMNEAFYNCRSLTTIDLPSSLTSIDEYAFKGCRSLKKIDISSNVTSIGDGAFADCQSLQELNVAEDNVHYSSEDAVLYDKTKTTIYCVAGGHQGEFVVKSDVKRIAPSAFWGCINLTSIVLPENLTYINNNTFMDCSKLTDIEIPSNVTTIGNYAFYNCSGLTTINIPSSVTSIGSYAFYNCSGFTTITIPSSVTSIGSYAFGNCKNLKVIIDNSKDSVFIDKNAFPMFTSITYLK